VKLRLRITGKNAAVEMATIPIAYRQWDQLCQDQPEPLRKHNICPGSVAQLGGLAVVAAPPFSADIPTSMTSSLPSVYH